MILSKRKEESLTQTKQQVYETNIKTILTNMFRKIWKGNKMQDIDVNKNMRKQKNTGVEKYTNETKSLLLKEF